MNFDDQPVGQHSVPEVPELPSEEVPTVASGPLEERLKSKNPKTRFEAFRDLVNKFEEAKAGDSIWELQYSSFPKYISDSHPGCQEKALEAFLLLLAKAPPKVDSVLFSVLTSIFEKGCTSQKTNTKLKAFQCLETITEMEGTQEMMKERIQEYLSAKGTQQKILVAVLQVSTHLLNVFGNSVFPIGNIVPLMLIHAGSTNAGIKIEAMNYFREAHRWVRAEILPYIDKLKQVQIDEFKKSVCDDSEIPVPKRMVKGIFVPSKMEDILSKKTECKRFDYDSAKEISILKKFGGAWGNSVLECKKWSEKRDKLEELVQASNVEKIKNENLGDLVSPFKLLLSDSNVVVNNQTIKIIGQLAKGLRLHYSTQSKLFYRIIVEKLRNKKTFVEAQKCLEYFALSIKPEDIIEEIKEALGDKTTQVRISMCTLLEKNIFPNSKKETVKSVSTAIIPILLKLSDDPASDVRDAVLSVIGIIKTKIDDATLNKTISQMNSQKQEKILKAAEQKKEESEPEKQAIAVGEARAMALEEVKAIAVKEVTNSDVVELNKIGVDVEEAKTSSIEVMNSIPIEEVKNIAVQEAENIAAIERKVVSMEVNVEIPNQLQSEPMNMEEIKSMPITNSPKTVTTPILLPPPPIKKKPIKKEDSKKHKFKEIKEEEIGDLMSLEKAIAQLEELTPTEIREGMDNADWKERLRCLQEFNTLLQNNTNTTADTSEASAVWMKSKLKEFKESNPSLMKEAISILNFIATTFSITKKFAAVVVPAIADKIGDVKLGESICSLMLNIADSVTPATVSFHLIRTLSDSKNVNSIKASFSLFSTMIDEYGIKLIPFQSTLEYAQFFNTHPNPQIRMAATRYIVSAYAAAGEIIKRLLQSDVVLLKSLDPDFAKTSVKDQKEASEIKRKLRGECELQVNSKKKGKDISESLMPRVNIAGQISTKILSNLTDPSMKHRQEAKEAIEKILTSANNNILPTGLGPLMTALKSRMNEPGKNLAKNFIILVGNLAQAMGSGCKQYNKVILQPLIYNLADKQTSIKSETLISVNKFAEAAGPETVINQMGPLLEKDNPDLRSEILHWILTNKQHIEKTDSVSLVNGLVAALQDRSKDIVNLATEVTAEVIKIVGHQVFLTAIQDLKPTVKSSLTALLDKYKHLAPIKKEEKMTDIEHFEPMEEVKRPEESSKVEFQPLPMDQIMTEEMEEVNLVEKRPTLESKTPIVAYNSITPLTKTISKPATPKKKKGDTKIIGGGKKLLAPPIEKNPKPLVSHSRPLTAATTKMSSSRSTNDLVFSDDRSMKSFERLNNKREDLELQKKITPAKGLRGTMIRQSPSKSQLSMGSNSGALYIEQAIINSIPKDIIYRKDKDLFCKWPVNEIRDDFVDRLKKALKQIIHPTVYEYMFSTFFKKNLEIVRIWGEAVRNDFSNFIDIQELIYKWFTIKMVDQSNTAMSKSILEVIRLIFTEMKERKKEMGDYETAGLLPMLCERTAISNVTLRDEIKTLIRMATEICTPKRVCFHLIQTLDSKSPKAKAECLALLREFIEANGLGVLVIKDFKTIAKQITNGDSSIRAEAVNVMGEIYKIKRDKLWTHLGDLPEKSKHLLGERFKAMDISQPPEGEEEVIEETYEIAHSMKKITISGSDKPAEDAVDDTRKKLDFPEIQSSVPIQNSESEPMEDVVSLPQPISELAAINEQKENTFIQPQETAPEKHVIPSEKKYLLESSNPKNLEECLEILKHSDVSKKVDALVCLNEKVTTFYEGNKETLIQKADLIIISFAEVIVNIFEKPKEIPLRFAKYLISVIGKYCGTKTIMKEASIPAMKILMEQLLAKLLIDGLEKMGENNEGECLINSLNTTMLRMLENSDSTKVFISLMELFKKTKGMVNTGKENLAKLPGLIIKCILKLIKIIETLLPYIEVSRLLLCLHEYMLSSPLTQAKSMNDEIGIRMTKTIVNELVKYRREKIWEDYKIIENHTETDQHIKKWIKVILKSLETSHPSSVPATPSVSKDPPDELKAIFRGLNSQATFNDAIKSLSEYLERNPHCDLNQYLSCCSKAFGQIVQSALVKYSTQQKSTLPVSTSSIEASVSEHIGSDGSKHSSLEDYKAKVAFLKQKLGMHPEAEAKIESKTQSSSTTEVYDKINKYKAMIQHVLKKP